MVLFSFIQYKILVILIFYIFVVRPSTVIPSYQVLTLIERTPDKVIQVLMIPDPVFNTIIYILVVRTVYIYATRLNKPKVKLSYLKLQRVLDLHWIKIIRFIFLTICTLECIKICNHVSIHVI